MHHVTRSFLAVGLLLTAPAAAAAQDRASEALQPGRRMIALSLPSHGTTAGFWVQRTTTLTRGIELTADFQHVDVSSSGPGQDRNRLSVVLSPIIKNFLARSHGAIAPYARAGVLIGYQREETATRQNDGWLAGVEAGFGAEWFPVERISVGGWLGAAASYAGLYGDHWSVRTVAPRITGQIYF